MSYSKANAAAQIVKIYPDWKGAKFLNILCQHPNQPIPASVLENSLYGIIPLSESGEHSYHFAPIKMTDPATLRAVDKRLNQLLAQKVAADVPSAVATDILSVEQSNADETSAATQTPDIDSEIAALIQYRKQCTIPGGGIRCFNDDDSAAFHRIRKAIFRLLLQAEKDGHHEAVAVIKANLKKGKIMRWETL